MSGGDHHALGHAAQNRFEFFALLGQGLDLANDRFGGAPPGAARTTPPNNHQWPREPDGGGLRVLRPLLRGFVCRSISTRTTIADATIPPTRPTPSTTASTTGNPPRAASTASSIAGGRMLSSTATARRRMIVLPKRLGVKAVTHAPDGQNQFRSCCRRARFAGATGARARRRCAARRTRRAPRPDRAAVRGCKPASDVRRKTATTRIRANITGAACRRRNTS